MGGQIVLAVVGFHLRNAPAIDPTVRPAPGKGLSEESPREFDRFFCRPIHFGSETCLIHWGILTHTEGR